MPEAVHVTRAPARQLPATPVESVPDALALPYFTGRTLVQVHDSLCYPMIQAGNVLDVDFDVREIRGDGLYLLYIPEPDLWFGARLFQRVPGGLRIKHGDEWRDATPEVMAWYTVCGYVHHVYKPAR